MTQRPFLAWTLPTLMLLVLASTAVAAKPEGKPHVYKTIGQRELTLYVTTPDDWKPSDRRPAIVFFHGGGWVGGQPGQFTEHSKYLASRGMVAVQVEYRLLDRKSNDPPTACVNDAKSAMRWVRSHADELGIDQQRVGDRYGEFSPFHNVSDDDPPAIVFLGSEDKLIPVKTAHDFQAAMEKAGNRSKVMIFEGQGHGFFNHGRDKNRPYYETVLATDKFLASLGWLSGPPTLQEP